MFIFFLFERAHQGAEHGVALFLKRLLSRTINYLLQNFGAVFSPFLTYDNFFMHKKEPQKKMQRHALALMCSFKQKKNFMMSNVPEQKAFGFKMINF